MTFSGHQLSRRLPDEISRQCEYLEECFAAWRGFTESHAQDLSLASISMIRAACIEFCCGHVRLVQGSAGFTQGEQSIPDHKGTLPDSPTN